MARALGALHPLVWRWPRGQAPPGCGTRSSPHAANRPGPRPTSGASAGELAAPARRFDLHVLHALAGLDLQAAAVEGETLAHQDQRSGGRFLARVLRHDEARLLGAALGHPSSAPKPWSASSAGPNTRLCRPRSPARPTARSARAVGVRWLAGSLTRSRARRVASLRISARSNDACGARASPSVAASSVTDSTAVSGSWGSGSGRTGRKRGPAPR